ncbi:MAG: UDP-N-acetylmuramate dehydrogenase [Oscillospiraceae bacterium]|nr:UDP-N-acetylmuramate dehydrogenase [Oscillospiraceae bacterium]
MLWYESFDRLVRRELPELCVLADESLAKYSSFRIGGCARRMAFPTSEEQTVHLVDLARRCDIRPVVLGSGTNVLFADEGLDRLVICTRELRHLASYGENGIAAGAGVPLAQLAVFAQQHALSGLEFAHGIPGSVGGAVCMNAGAYGGEIKDVLAEATLLFPGEGVRHVDAADLQLGYRRSLITDLPEAIVLSAVFTLEQGDKAAIRERMTELMERRKTSQPLEYPSAGSTFKRPAGYYAGPLIEQAGLKGLCVGGAQVSEKHAGFIVNRGGATCRDVLELMERVRQTVQEQSGVMLEPEVKVIR